MKRGVQHLMNDRRALLGEPVIHPDALPARFDKTSPAQIGEMSRDRRLRQAEPTVDMTHADFAVAEQRENPEPGLISQRAIHLDQLPRAFQARQGTAGAASGHRNCL